MSNEERKPYGEFGKVLLNDWEIEKLKEKYPIDEIKNAVEELDAYCAAHGKKYKDYRAAIHNWIKKSEQYSKPKRAAAGQISRKPTYDINEISRKAAQNTEIKY